MKNKGYIFAGSLLLACAIFVFGLGAHRASAATYPVTISDNAYQPVTLTVNQGDTVVWTNTGSVAHTVTADLAAFDSGNLGSAATFFYTFNTAGSYAYYDKTYGAPGLVGMSGDILVLAAASTSSSSLPTIGYLAASPSSITAGQQATLSWTTTGATAASLDNGIGSVSLSGSENVAPSVNTTYTLTASNASGSVTSAVSVSVSGASDNSSQNSGSSLLFDGSAAPASSGLRLINDAGTFYLIMDGAREGITNPGILQSYGFAFSQAAAPTAADLALPVGDNLAPNDGALVKSPSDPTVWLISGAARHGFTSQGVFTAAGFSFSQVLTVTAPELNKLPVGAAISNGSAAHLPGLDISARGTVYWIDSNSTLHPYPSADVYNTWHVAGDFSKVVPYNQGDLSLQVGDPVQARVLQ